MSRKGNFYHNAPIIHRFLKDNDIPYQEFAGGQHLRIMGATKLVDLWPSRMTYHVIEAEDVISSEEMGYPKLKFNCDVKQLEELFL